MEKRRVFKNNLYQEKIEKDGFVVIPFLSESEVNALRDIYNNISSSIEDKEFYLSIWSDSENYKGETHHKIVEVIKKKCQDLLDNYKHVVSNFAVKHPGDNSGFDLHQGINFIDESEGHVSITVWIPLQDVNEENGNMQVIRGSHKFFDQDVRSQHYQTPYEALKPYIKQKYLENLPMKAGEAWIFNHRLLHCSPPNKTSNVRIATLNSMAPAESPILLYFKNEANRLDKEVEILEFSEDNYYLQNVKGKPNLPGILTKGKTQEVQYSVGKEEFDALYEKYNMVKN